MMKKEYDIDFLVSQMDFSSNSYKNIGNGIFLTNREVEILNKYKLPYYKCNSLKEILFMIEDGLASMNFIEEDLESISTSIAERDYYQNTNH